MSVTVRECASMRLLARDGWTAGELKMTFSLTRTHPVYKHVEGKCSHDHDVSNLRNWDGETPPQT